MSPRNPGGSDDAHLNPPVGPDGTAAPTQVKCPHCGVLNEAGSRFCEACGRSLAEPVSTHPSSLGAARPPKAGVETSAPGLDTASPAGSAGSTTELDDVSPISAVTVRPGESAEPDAGPRAPCLQCGGEVDDDGYCTQCGTKAPSARDHFEERPAAWVAGVCDRGIRHHRNEDAMAMAVDGQRVVLVVCDGVSNTVDSHIGSMNAARAVLDVLRPPLPRGLGVPESRSAAITGVFTDAAEAGQRAIVGTVSDDVPNPPSCTLVAAVLEGDEVHYCGLGDSRIYLLPDSGDGQILTVDDSMAQLLIAGGTPRAEAEASRQAHSITKWLGKDSTDTVPRVGQADVTGPGWLLACSDGLWNYASEPTAVRAQIEAAGSPDPLAIARHLVKFANDCGGQDNIAVALARVGQPPVEEGARPLVEEGGAEPDGGLVTGAGAPSSTTEAATSSTNGIGKNAPDGGESHG